MAKDSDNLCPILMLAKTTAETDEHRQRSARCRRARCKWWNDTETKCAVLVISEKP